jgi:AAA15 family ATPase/GTPase
MLLSFSVSNFRSFREEQTLSMVASGRQPDHTEHLNRIPNDENQALPVAVLYGANGAGKSNFVKGVQFVEQLVLRGTEPKKPIVRQNFALDKMSKKEPTEFVLQFVEEPYAYAYGFRASDKYIIAEWLSLLRDGKETPIFERVTDDGEKVTIEPGLSLTDDSWGDNSKVLALTKVGVLPNQLFLHAVGNSLRDEDQGPVLAGALKWFRERLNIIPAKAAFSDLALLVAQDESFANFAGDFLKQVATGVDRLRVDTAEIPETLLPANVQRVIEGLPPGGTTNLARPDGTALLVEKGEGTKVQVRSIQSEHVTAEGDRVALPFSEESDGTQRLTHLLPALHAIRQQPGLYVIDEIDRSLHPLLAKGFVRAFLQACAGKGNQLIFTTHETAFLDLELLRRDEIWFADKKRPAGTTQLYSLADYKVRTDLKIDKAYLQGRFEAVPPIEAELPGWVREIMAELQPKGSSEPAIVE